MADRELVKLPAGARGMPDWVKKDAKNARGVCPVNPNHYIGLVQFGNAVMEVTLDSGGTRTMIDEHTARLIGLDVDWADQSSKNYGSFSGANGENSPYLGMVRSPVKIKFGPGLEFLLKDVKVFGYP